MRTPGCQHVQAVVGGYIYLCHRKVTRGSIYCLHHAPTLKQLYELLVQTTPGTPDSLAISNEIVEQLGTPDHPVGRLNQPEAHYLQYFQTQLAVLERQLDELERLLAERRSR